MLSNPPEVFEQEILRHFATHGTKMCERLLSYCRETDPLKPEFFLPVSKGLKLSLKAPIASFQETLKTTLEKQQ